MRGLVAAAALMLAGCGASDEERAARALEAYLHGLGTGDAQAACDTLSPEARGETSPGRRDRCESLEATVAELRPEVRRGYRAARAVDVQVRGDEASGSLRFPYGSCDVETDASSLSRDGSGEWRIDVLGAVATTAEGLDGCLDR